MEQTDTNKTFVINASIFNQLIEGFELNLRKEINDEKFIVLEIEDYRGSTIAAAYIDLSNNRILKSDKTYFNYKYNCPVSYETFSFVNVDDDYLFGTSAPLIRLQANSEDSWLCKDLVPFF